MNLTEQLRFKRFIRETKEDMRAYAHAKKHDIEDIQIIKPTQLHIDTTREFIAKCKKCSRIIHFSARFGRGPKDQAIMIHDSIGDFYRYIREDDDDSDDVAEKVMKVTRAKDEYCGFYESMK